MEINKEGMEKPKRNEKVHAINYKFQWSRLQKYYKKFSPVSRAVKGLSARNKKKLNK